jgi:hypothetical protein
MQQATAAIGKNKSAITRTSQSSLVVVFEDEGEIESDGLRVGDKVGNSLGLKDIEGVDEVQALPNPFDFMISLKSLPPPSRIILSSYSTVNEPTKPPADFNPSPYASLIVN